MVKSTVDCCNAFIMHRRVWIHRRSLITGFAAVGILSFTDVGIRVDPRNSELTEDVLKTLKEAREDLQRVGSVEVLRFALAARRSNWENS